MSPAAGLRAQLGLAPLAPNQVEDEVSRNAILSMMSHVIIISDLAWAHKL